MSEHRRASLISLRRLLLAILVGAAATACGPRREAAPPDSQDEVTPPPAPEARLAFALVSPQAGDLLIEGNSYVIRWMAPDSFRINLGAMMGGKDKGHLLTGAPARPDSLTWTVPVGFVTGFGISESNQVRLRLENAEDPNQWTEAGPFTIQGAKP